MRTQKIVFRGEEITATELAKRFNLSPTTVCRRYDKGLREEELVAPYKYQAHHKGNMDAELKSRNWYELSRELGISRSCLNWRIKNGWKTEDLGKEAKTPIDYDLLIGTQFGDSIIEALTDPIIRASGNKDYTAHCVCNNCGKHFTILLSSLRKSNSSIHCKNCAKDKKHNIRMNEKSYIYHRERIARTGMIFRCYNPKSKQYPNYGGRGITVCDRWLESFDNFIEDMGKCPEGYSIDRIDVNGNYEPSNCRWANLYQQCNNKTTSHYLSYGKICLTAAQWGALLGEQGQRFRAYEKRNGNIDGLIEKLRKADHRIDEMLSEIEQDDCFVSIEPIYDFNI